MSRKRTSPSDRRNRTKYFNIQKNLTARAADEIRRAQEAEEYRQRKA